MDKPTNLTSLTGSPRGYWSAAVRPRTAEKHTQAQNGRFFWQQKVTFSAKLFFISGCKSDGFCVSFMFVLLHVLQCSWLLPVLFIMSACLLCSQDLFLKILFRVSRDICKQYTTKVDVCDIPPVWYTTKFLELFVLKFSLPSVSSQFYC